MELRATYSEPCNLYGICIGFPGCEKSQAFRMTVTDPLAALSRPFNTMLIDDYTKKGLQKHIVGHEGQTLIAQAEMGAFFDLVHKRQVEGQGESQIYCRLYDAGEWSSVTAGTYHITHTFC